MRVAFHILDTDGAVTVEFFNATEMHENPEPVVARWEGDEPILWSSVCIDRWNRKLMRYLHTVNEKLGGSPVQLVRALLGLGGKQVVWDAKHSKYRNLSTAQDGAKTYTLVGTKIQIEAADEKEAAAKGQHAITRAMAKDPEQAETLAKWFRGQKVKLVDSEEVPQPIPLIQLARNAHEKKLAELPIQKISLKDEDDKDEKDEE